MKKYFVMIVALLAVVAIAVPSFAVDVKFGGMFRIRGQANDNVTDGTYEVSDLDRFWLIQNNVADADKDNQLYVDQRLRMYFTFIASENLQVVTKWEADTIWGDENGAGRHGGGDVGADAVNLEMKNAYLDFAIPCTPLRATMGVQGLAMMSGWIVDDDFSAAVVKSKFDPFTVMAGYIAGRNEEVSSISENIDDLFLHVDYTNGPWKVTGTIFYQDAHDNFSSQQGLLYSSPSSLPGWNYTDTDPIGGFHIIDYASTFGFALFPDDDQLIDLGLSVQYKTECFLVFLNFVKNFGGFESFNSIEDEDYNGWMVEGRGSYFYGPWTFTLGAFYTSGDDVEAVALTPAGLVLDADWSSFFRYPIGRSHYWSEILGLGTLDTSGSAAGLGDRINTQAGYAAGDGPSNLWMINAGAAWQALEGTKLTLNYYYIGTSGDVVANLDYDIFGIPVDVAYSSSVGHEIDFYLDQKVVDGLNLRLVAAYLIADDAYTAFEDDDDTYELGAQLLWAF